MATRSRDGGLIELQELKRRLEKMREVSNQKGKQQEITELGLRFLRFELLFFSLAIDAWSAGMISYVPYER